jgi:hypothetical protein
MEFLKPCRCDKKEKASDKSEASKVFRYWWLISYSKTWIMFLKG